MNLSGKTIHFLGDSITFGHGVTDPDNIFCNRIAARFGATARNYGIGGTRYARQAELTAWEIPDLHRPFFMRVEDMAPDADLVVVLGGVNDYAHGDAPLGSMDDRTPDTFYGAAHMLYTALLARYPTATVVVATPLHCLGEENPRGLSGKKIPSAPLSAYVEVIREVAAYDSLPLLDLYAASGISPALEVHRTRYMPDGVHPNDHGHALIASRLAGFLESL